MKKRKKTKDLRQHRTPDNPFDTLSVVLTYPNNEHASVSVRALKTLLKFAKYHRQWRLMVGYNDTGRVPLDVTTLDRVDKKRIKYYAQLFGIDPAALHENVHMHDAPGGGGSYTRKASKIERTASRAALTLSSQRKRK